MLDFRNHPLNCGRIFEFLGRTDLFKTERRDRRLDGRNLSDCALYERHFYLSHVVLLLSAQNLFYGLAAKRRHLLCRLQLRKTRHSRFHAVAGVLGAVGFRTDVFDPDGFHHRTDGAARDNAGTFRSGHHQHRAAAETTEHLVGNGVIDHRDGDHVLFRPQGSFFDGFGDLFRLARADADLARAVADDDERRKTHIFAALHRFGNAVYLDQLLDESVILRLSSLRSSVFSFFVCHCRFSYQNLSPASLAPSATAFTRPV